MRIKIPLGAWDLYGMWYPNENLKMPTIDQFIHNANAGYIKSPEHKTPNDVIIEMKLLFLFGCATDMRNKHYKVEMAKAKIREQSYFIKRTK